MQLSLISLALTKVYGGTPSFTPLSLFASGEQGAWYDPSDLTTMFQDSAGTTPVTVDGQPVGKILDKSGRGNHATQATAASRPLYKTDGTYHWLQFDGVDDSLSTATFGITTLSGDVFIGIKHVTNTVWADVWLTTQLADGYWAIGQSGAGVLPTGASCGTPTYRRNGVDMVAPTRSTIYTTHIDQNVVQTTKGLVFGDSTPSGVSISGYPGAYVCGNIYSLIVRVALSTADEITATETWVNNKTGAF